MSATSSNDKSFISQTHFQLINESEAKFILEHGEKQLKDILETSLQIVNRSATLLTVAVGLIVALSGFCIKRWDENKHLWEQELFIALWFAIYLTVMVLVLFFNFIPRTYLIAGAEPADFFKTDEVFKETNSSYRMIAIYVNEITQAQIKIKHNKEINDKKWKYFNCAIYMICGVPLYILIIYWISTCQSWNLI
jgi:hypothetical protein